MSDLSRQILTETIIKLKKEKNAVILAHNYQRLEVQSVADFIGDSLQLAQEAAKIKAEIIVFCGVLFMAETTKLINPNAKVLLSAMDAGCPMANMINAEQLRNFKAQHQNPYVVCYVNSTVEVKAESDICVTSSNAVKVVNSIPQDKTILFVPDKNLGNYVQKMTGREIICWNGFCTVHHNKITVSDIKYARKAFPDHTILIHPECTPEVVALADIVASTKGMADYADTHDNIIIGTEYGLYEQLKLKYPHKHILPLSEKATCINMKKTILKDVMITLLEERNEITIDPAISEAALKPITRMLGIN